MKTFLSLALLVLTASFAFSADGDTYTIKIDWTPGSTGAAAALRLKDFNGSQLTLGSSTVVGDGMVFQLGYYSSGSTTFNFGTTADGSDWIALTGAGSANSTFSTLSVGDVSSGSLINTFIPDDGATAGGPGQLGNLSLTFTEGSTGTGLIPTSTAIPLVLRFYDTASIGPSSHYNALSADTWTWPSVGGTRTLSEAATVEWLDTNSPAKTSIPVGGAAIPEPSTYALLGMGLLGFLVVRRKE